MISGWFKNRISIINYSKRKRDWRNLISSKRNEVNLKKWIKIIMHIKIGWDRKGMSIRNPWYVTIISLNSSILITRVKNDNREG